jgi:TPR repeat protein
VPKNDAEAMKWYRLAADQGDATAQYFLGGTYHFRQPQNYAEALKWYRRAAEQGHASAQNILGLVYEGGCRRITSAHTCGSTCRAAQGNEPASKGRDTAATVMTPAQIAEAQKPAREWQPKQP